MEFTERGRVGARLDAREARRLVMSSEEGGLVVPKPARGRRGTMAVKIPTRREALEKAVEHLLAEVEKSHCSVEMAPQYEEDLGRVRDYLGVEKVGGKRLREVEGVSDARERLKIGGDARPAGGELMLVPIKEEKTARPEVEEGNEEDEEKERGGLKRKSEDDVGPLTKVSLRVNRGKMSAQSEEDRASDQERRGFERGWTTRREWICPSQLTRLTEEDYAELGVYARTLGIYDDVRLSWEHQLRGVQRYLYNVAGELLSEEKIKVSKKKEYPPSVPFAPGERVEFMLAENVWVEGVLTARFTKTHVMVALDNELLRRAWCCIRRVRSKGGRDDAPDVVRENAAGGGGAPSRASKGGSASDRASKGSGASGGASGRASGRASEGASEGASERASESASGRASGGASGRASSADGASGKGDARMPAASDRDISEGVDEGSDVAGCGSTLEHADANKGCKGGRASGESVDGERGDGGGVKADESENAGGGGAVIQTPRPSGTGTQFRLGDWFPRWREGLPLREKGMELEDGARLKFFASQFPLRMIPPFIWHWCWVRRFILPFDERCTVCMDDLESSAPVMVNGRDARVHQSELLPELRGVSSASEEWQQFLCHVWWVRRLLFGSEYVRLVRVAGGAWSVTAARGRTSYELLREVCLGGR